MNEQPNDTQLSELPFKVSNKKDLASRYKSVRDFTLKLCEPLQTEDFVIQSMPDVSPTKWHLAHTSWFFEAFVLKNVNINYKSINPLYNYLFNSYYVQIGERYTRAMRGLLSRPTVKEIYAYRNYVDQHVLEFIENCKGDDFFKFGPIIEIGINHEQQHQELLVTDIKHVFSINPLNPVYIKSKPNFESIIPKQNWIEFPEGLYDIGYVGENFFYDNETPKHKHFLNSFKLASRLVTNGEYIEFIESEGYKKPELWLSDGFATVEKENWKAPLYWEKVENEWWNFKLTGFQKVNPDEPVTHVSLFEADAFARWSEARLPSEEEWEIASENIKIKGNFVENGFFHPSPLQNENDENKIHQMYGDVWEWTKSSYSPYPGYKPLPGALGEYNGKFMSSQIVLRGGSCATSKSHIRNTYRNFFYPHSRWQFMGIRLASD